MTRSLLLALLLTVSACVGPARPATVALQVLPEAGAQPLLRAIDGATRSIDLEVYLLAHPDVITSLRAARARSVRVRVLLEERPFGTATNGDTYAELQRGGVEVRWTDPALRYTHAKLLLVDGTQAWAHLQQHGRVDTRTDPWRRSGSERHARCKPTVSPVPATLQ